MKTKWIIYVLLLFTCLGCGYRFSPGGENIAAEIQEIFVGEFSNSTSEANVENYIRNAFFTRFRRSSRFTVVADKDRADAVLAGKIKSITTSHVAYSSSDMAKEDRVYMVLEVAFTRTDNGKSIWTNKGLTGREAYNVQTDVSSTSANKNVAIRELSIDMADKAFRNIMSGF